MRYPKQEVKLFLRCKNGCITRGMYYCMGGAPRFASYGRDITEQVVGCEYAPETEEWRDKVRDGGTRITVKTKKGLHYVEMNGYTRAHETLREAWELAAFLALLI